MPFVTSAEKARSERKAIDVLGQEYFLSPYVGSAPKRGQYVPGNEKNDDGLPQGFLVEQPPNSVTRPHFHNHEQFQLFVGGSAHMGKKATPPFSLHYVKGHTPYGPITAGPEGVTYFTLRARWDTGAKYMPESRDLLKKSSKKHKMICDRQCQFRFDDLIFAFSAVGAAGVSSWSPVVAAVVLAVAVMLVVVMLMVDVRW